MKNGSVTIRRERRKSMALKVTPRGLVALIPTHLDPDGEQVQRFIQDTLANLSDLAGGPDKLEPEPLGEPLTPAQVHDMVREWSQKLGVTVVRTQIRPMRNKWGSISTAGALTLADDLLGLPCELVEYVVVHELLHLKFPDHGKGWQVSMGMYLPDWRERERRFRYVTQASMI